MLVLQGSIEPGIEIAKEKAKQKPISAPVPALLTSPANGLLAMLDRGASRSSCKPFGFSFCTGRHNFWTLVLGCIDADRGDSRFTG